MSPSLLRPASYLPRSIPVPLRWTPLFGQRQKPLARDPFDMPFDDKSPEFEERWAAWQRKNRLHDQRIKRRMRFALLGLGALFAVMTLYCWVSK
jgi:hypothetical protein